MALITSDSKKSSMSGDWKHHLILYQFIVTPLVYEVPIVAPKCPSLADEATEPWKTQLCPFMFMFRTKRNTLAKRLWKARVVKREHEASGETETFSSSPTPSYCCCCCSNKHTNSCSQQQQCYSAEMVRSDLLKRLKESQLEMLLAAIESRGADLSACVLLPRDQPPLLDPRLLCCQLWRWPDLRQAAELKRLPVCRSSKDTVYICCNPYHWSRLCKPGKLQNYVRDRSLWYAIRNKTNKMFW